MYLIKKNITPHQKLFIPFKAKIINFIYKPDNSRKTVISPYCFYVSFVFSALGSVKKNSLV